MKFSLTSLISGHCADKKRKISGPCLVEAGAGRGPYPSICQRQGVDGLCLTTYEG